MRKLGLRWCLLLACVLVFAVGAYADVPPDLIVHRGGLEWVWASPCAPEQPSCGATLDLDLNGGGWRIPTTEDWLSSFSDAHDLYLAFNDPVELCASPYWNSGFSHCDPGDVDAGYNWGAPPPIGNDDANNPLSESFLVRGDQGGVPEPGTMLLLGTGALGIVARIRRKLTL